MTRNQLASLMASTEARARLTRGPSPGGRPRKLERFDARSAPARLSTCKTVAPPWSDEARKLRKGGWTLPGLAKRYGVDQFEIARALGEHLERAW